MLHGEGAGGWPTPQGSGELRDVRCCGSGLRFAGVLGGEPRPCPFVRRRGAWVGRLRGSPWGERGVGGGWAGGGRGVADGDVIPDRAGRVAVTIGVRCSPCRRHEALAHRSGLGVALQHGHDHPAIGVHPWQYPGSCSGIVPVPSQGTAAPGFQARCDRWFRRQWVNIPRRVVRIGLSVRFASAMPEQGLCDPDSRAIDVAQGRRMVKAYVGSPLSVSARLGQATSNPPHAGVGGCAGRGRCGRRASNVKGVLHQSHTAWGVRGHCGVGRL